jgi:sugar phosphate isomerase/epimerase
MGTSSVNTVLWAGVVRQHGLRDQIAGAAAAGFDKLSIPPDIYLKEVFEGRSARQILDMAAEHGIQLDYLDGFASWAPVRYSEHDGDFVRQVLGLTPQKILDICGELNLKHIVAIGWFPLKAFEAPYLAENFARFCDQAAARGIRVDLEFTPIWGIHDLRTAWEVVRLADRPNGGILIDTWHFVRSGYDIELLRFIPGERLATVQLADGGQEPRGGNLLMDSLRHRSMPGEGDFPIVPILEVLRSKGGVTGIGPEIFHLTPNPPSAEVAAAHGASTTKNVMQLAGFN